MIKCDAKFKNQMV